MPGTNKSAKSGSISPITSTIVSRKVVTFDDTPNMFCNRLVVNPGSVASSTAETFPRTSQTTNSKTIRTTVNRISLLKPARKPTKAANAKIPNTASEKININVLVFIICTPLSVYYSLILPKKWLIGKQINSFLIFFGKNYQKCDIGRVLGLILNYNSSRKYLLN